MKPPKRVLVADDDRTIADHLQGMIRHLEPSWEVLDVVADGPALLKAVEEQMPDVLLLDIHMPGHEGINEDMLSTLGELSYQPSTIVVSGDPTRGVEAFDKSVVDYLIKPVTPARLRRALQRVNYAPPPGVTESPDDEGPANRWISALRGTDIVIVDPSDIVYLQAERKHTRIVLKEGEALLKQGISEVARSLNERYFVRIHRSTIVNVRHIDFVRRDEFGRMRVHFAHRREKPIVSRPFEMHFRG